MNKRQRNEVSESKVIHVKGLPGDVSRDELADLLAPFGNVVEVLLLPGKNHAFVQMEEVEQAEKAISHYSSNHAYIRSSPVQLEYSNRQEITIKQTQRNTSSTTDEPSPNTVLLVNIVNMRLYVSIDNLYTVFSHFGDVLRIITFQKKTFQAFVEFAHLNSASSARRQLDNKDMFQGCCTLRISFASQSAPLKVRQNDERSWDFTSGQMPSSLPFPYSSSQSPPGQAPYGGSSASSYFSSQPALPSGGQGCVLLVNNLVSELVTPDVLFTLFGVYGDVQRVKILYNNKGTALIQFSNAHQAQTAKQHLNNVDLYGQNIAITVSRHTEVSLGAGRGESKDEGERLTKDFSQSRLHRFKRGGKNELHICPPSSTLHFSNMPEKTGEDTVRKLLADFDSKPQGIEMFGEGKMAYVKFGSIAEAIKALIQYHNQKIGDRYMRVTFSQKKRP